MKKQFMQVETAQSIRLDRRRLLQLGGATLLALPLLAACSVASEKMSFLVVIRGPDGVLYDPGTLTIPRGATVAWQNHDTAPHTVTCDPALAQKQGGYAELPQNAQPWDSGDLYNGQIWSYTFTTPGQYIYSSKRDGMGRPLGTIVVAT